MFHPVNGMATLFVTFTLVREFSSYRCRKERHFGRRYVQWAARSGYISLPEERASLQEDVRKCRQTYWPKEYTCTELLGLEKQRNADIARDISGMKT